MMTIEERDDLSYDLFTLALQRPPHAAFLSRLMLLPTEQEIRAALVPMGVSEPMAAALVADMVWIVSDDSAGEFPAAYAELRSKVDDLLRPSARHYR